jgi:integrase
VTLKRYAIVEHTQFIHEPRRPPRVLSSEEVARLLDAAPGLKYKAALSVAYGTGLRASEVVSLKISDIDSKRMLIRVEQGKGRKDRNVMLSPHLLKLLRAWWKAAHPQGWLFPGRDPVQPSHAGGVASIRANRASAAHETCRPCTATPSATSEAKFLDKFSGAMPRWDANMSLP